MKKNIGTFDKGIRVLVGLALMLGSYVGLIGPWGLLGIIPFITGAFGYCPLYSILKINTLEGRIKHISKP